jgi:hypothetical protein
MARDDHDLMSILFATPMYGGNCTEPFFHSVMRTVQELERLGVDYDFLTERNESLVHRARMEMTAAFLRTDHTHLFWIDADIEFEPAHVAALWNMQADIACGCYAMKKPDKQWFAAWKDGALVKDLDQFDGPIEVDYAGTGFLLIRREVIETLAARVPSWDGVNGPVPALFMTPIHNGCLESEDYHFCRIAREAGYKIMMDPSVRLGHWGMARYGA